MGLVPTSSRGVTSSPVTSVFTRTGAIVAADADYYGAVSAALTGATGASRYVGATTSGAPVAGTFAVGDLVVDRAGGAWTCTVAGTPGTWAPAVPAASVSNTHIAPGAAIAASKIQGGTNATSGGLYLIASQTRATNGTLDITGIDQSYSDLFIVIIARAALTGANNDTLVLYLNNDTTQANYEYNDNFNVATTPTTFKGAGLNASQSIPAANAAANYWGTTIIEICGYSSTLWYKTAVCKWGVSWSADQRSGITGGTWLNTAAVNRITAFSPTNTVLLTGSTMRIYGRP